MLIIQALIILAVAIYTAWLFKETVKLVWANGLDGKQTSGEEVLRLAFKPLIFALDLCVVYPLRRLIAKKNAAKG